MAAAEGTEGMLAFGTLEALIGLLSTLFLLDFEGDCVPNDTRGFVT